MLTAHPLDAASSSSPTKLVAEGYSAAPPPFGLDRPLELRGGRGGRMPDLAARLGCPWNATLLEAVSAACLRQSASGRPWLRLDPLILTGPTGAGRSHLARRLAWEAGVPHLPIDVGGDAGEWSLGADTRGPTPARPSALAVAMGSSGCANPVIDVSGLVDVRDDVFARLIAAIDPMNGRLDDEALGAIVDLSEATWLIQLPTDAEPPPALVEVATVIALSEPLGREWQELAWIDTIADLAADRGADLGAGPTEWICELLVCAGDGIAAAERYRLAAEAFDRAVGLGGI